MNILFLYSSSIDKTKGGVQRVTAVLADYFEQKGHVTLFLALEKSTTKEQVDARQYYLPNENLFLSKENITFYKQFLIDKKINIVVNQGGNDPHCTQLSFCVQSSEIKIVSVVHNSLLSSISNYKETKTGFFRKYLLVLSWIVNEKFLGRVLLKLYKLKYKSHYNRLCTNSNLVLLLSDRYKEELMHFTNESFINKVQSLPNPCSFNMRDIATYRKKKIILYVGRVDFGQKRVDLLLSIWEDLFLKFPDWQLKIVGNGPDLPNARKLAESLDLKNVFFEGFQQPEEYYKEASVFCMTSSFEGFPMVLVEAMYYGVIPIVYDSFKSVRDLINDGNNGFIIDKFDNKKYVSSLTEIMTNYENYEIMMINCQNSAQKFSIEIIGDKWLSIFNELLGIE